LYAALNWLAVPEPVSFSGSWLKTQYAWCPGLEGARHRPQLVVVLAGGDAGPFHECALLR
jgi:hypothetical protein